MDSTDDSPLLATLRYIQIQTKRSHIWNTPSYILPISVVQLRLPMVTPKNYPLEYPHVVQVLIISYDIPMKLSVNIHNPWIFVGNSAPEAACVDFSRPPAPGSHSSLAPRSDTSNWSLATQSPVGLAKPRKVWTWTRRVSMDQWIDARSTCATPKRYSTINILPVF